MGRRCLRKSPSSRGSRCDSFSVCKVSHHGFSVQLTNLLFLPCGSIVPSAITLTPCTVPCWSANIAASAYAGTHQKYGAFSVLHQTLARTSIVELVPTMTRNVCRPASTRVMMATLSSSHLPRATHLPFRQSVIVHRLHILARVDFRPSHRAVRA